MARRSRHWTREELRRPTRPSPSWNLTSTKPSVSGRDKALHWLPVGLHCCSIPSTTALGRLARLAGIKGSACCLTPRPGALPFPAPGLGAACCPLASHGACAERHRRAVTCSAASLRHTCWSTCACAVSIRAGSTRATLPGVCGAGTAYSLMGPSWRQQPSPLSQDDAALVILLDVSSSMQQQDIQPSRLQRANRKYPTCWPCGRTRKQR